MRAWRQIEEADFGFWVALLEFPRDWRDEVVEKGREKTKPQRAAGPAELLLGLLHAHFRVAEQLTGFQQEELPGLGEVDALLNPVKQGHAELLLQQTDLPAQRRLGNMHPHREMEIFSYVVSGTIAHKDSMGNGRELKPGQVQLMSAGTGVTHSEFNPSSSEPLHLLQIWIRPKTAGLVPSYTEWDPAPESDYEAKALLISSDRREQSAQIHQDADVYRVRLKAGESVTHELGDGRALWLQLIQGQLHSLDVALQAGDAVSSESLGSHTFTATEDSEALLFDLA